MDEVEVFHDLESLSQAAAHLFLEESKKAAMHSHPFRAVLSGGKTPMRTYQILSKEPFRSQIDWKSVHFFWGDERCVSADDSRSNYGEVSKVFLRRIPIPSKNVHPITNYKNAATSAAEYERALRYFFQGGPPHFDLVFLGLGTDGHTASIFPGHGSERARWVIPVTKPTESISRVTLSSSLLNQTDLALFLVVGREKARILKEILVPDRTNNSLPAPAQLIHPVNGKVKWFVSESAYQFLKASSS